MEATDLVSAAKDGDLLKVEQILKFYPTQVDIRQNGHTALHAAARGGHLEVIKTLVNHSPKPDLDFPDSKDSTPLHYAVKADKAEAVLLLLNIGANPDEEDSDGKTPYDIACKRNYEDCISAFRERGNKPAPKNDGTSSDDEEMDKPTSSADSAIPQRKCCKYCKENSRFIKFEPCGCVISCFECSMRDHKCRCEKFIEQRSFDKTTESAKYAEEIKSMRKRLEQLEHYVEQLEDQKICKICRYNPVNCALGCGHLFCKSCIRKTKDSETSFPEQLWICAKCRTPSRYTKIYPEW